MNENRLPDYLEHTTGSNPDAQFRGQVGQKDFLADKAYSTGRHRRTLLSSVRLPQR